MKTILGVRITDRVSKAQEIQDILTKFGCNIKTRLGLHDVSDVLCDTAGVLIVDTFGKQDEIESFEKELADIDGVDVQKMVFK